MKTMFCTTYYDPKKRNDSSISLSLAGFGVDIINFGARSPFDGFLRTKLVPLRDFIAGSASDVVVFLDGNDTILTSAPEALLASWESLGGGVVVGSELASWPYPQRQEAMDRIAASSGSKSPYRYMDTGLIMGKREAVIGVLDTVIGSVKKYRTQLKTVPQKIIEDDVGLFVLNLTDGEIEITIDYQCTMIAALKNVDDNKDYSLANGKLHLNLTGTTPHVIHCNGHRWVDKRRLENVSSAILGVKARKMEKAG